MKYIDEDLYKEAIEFVIEEGLMCEIEEKVFAPDDKITRQDLAVALARFIRKMQIEIPTVYALYPPYDDNDEISDDAKEAIILMRNTGLMVGKNENKFEPNETVTRAELADVLYKLYTKMNK